MLILPAGKEGMSGAALGRVRGLSAGPDSVLMRTRQEIAGDANVSNAVSDVAHCSRLRLVVIACGC